MAKFVDEWNIIQTLGEGAYGEVKLLIHQKTNEAVAMKIVDFRKCKDAKDCVTKEEKIHRHMSHPNIIRLLGKREETNMIYIFLEYAAGGELFNAIEPDVGMSSGNAQKYMKQLLDGVQYLHSKGVTHRDIKPENLLLDEYGNIKISDFGMATIFRVKGRERYLDKKCGTLPYVAPEVLVKPYHAQPADLWSCGIVLVAMLAGELPWDEPRESCKEYVKWKKDSCITETPWSKLSNAAYSLARKILSCNPNNRPTLQQILDHPWMNTIFPESDIDEVDSDCEPKAKRHTSVNESRHEQPNVTLSQPTMRTPNIAPANIATLLQNREQICFSQPTQNDDYFVGSQLLCTQTLSQNHFHRLIKRMTRFFVKTTYENAISHLCQCLDNLCYSWNSDPSGVVTISTVDSRKMPLVFKANAIDMDGKLLLDFRLTKGCGLEFKKRFVKIKYALTDIIHKV